MRECFESKDRAEHRFRIGSGGFVLIRPLLPRAGHVMDDIAGVWLETDGSIGVGPSERERDFFTFTHIEFGCRCAIFSP